jgi:hypothetical protein
MKKLLIFFGCSIFVGSALSSVLMSKEYGCKSTGIYSNFCSSSNLRKEYFDSLLNENYIKGQKFATTICLKHNQLCTEAALTYTCENPYDDLRNNFLSTDKCIMQEKEYEASASLFKKSCEQDENQEDISCELYIKYEELLKSMVLNPK